jgi:hypothetical protein
MSDPAPKTKAKRPFRDRARGLLGRLGLVLASVAVALGIAEIAARIEFPPMQGISWYHYDPRYGYRHRENADATTTAWGDGKPWRFRTNARGFRGPSFADAPAAGTSRALVMGDSFTFGNALAEGETYPEVAHMTLRDRAEGAWEVINAGVSAWGPQNALAYLATEGDKIQASCLIYGFFEGNDVMDGVAAPRLYDLRNGDFVRIPSIVTAPSTLSSVRDWTRKIPLYDALIEHSQLFNVVRNSTISQLAKSAGGAAGGDDPYLKATPEEFERALALNDVTLDHLLMLARSRFGAFALVLIPMRAQVATSEKSTATTPFPLWMAEASHKRMIAWAKVHEVPVLDWAEVLPKDPAALARAYFTKDFHMSAEGNRTLGRALGERIPSMCARR